jgi:hypothetical protein
LGQLNVEARWNDTTFVEATIKLDHYFSGTMVIDDFEFPDVP